ncbi:MAG: DoxX family protein [Dongiaceae bacterium]
MNRNLEGRMIHTQTASIAALLLRLSMGIMLIAHGFYLKIFVFTMAGASGFFESIGLPGWFAWVVMLYETIGGIALILGVFTRWVSAFLGVHLLFAAYLGHWAIGPMAGSSRRPMAAGNFRCSGRSCVFRWPCSARGNTP